MRLYFTSRDPPLWRKKVPFESLVLLDAANVFCPEKRRAACYESWHESERLKMYHSTTLIIKEPSPDHFADGIVSQVSAEKN